MWGPGADRHAKLLIHLAMEGSLLEAYSHRARDANTDIQRHVSVGGLGAVEGHRNRLGCAVERHMLRLRMRATTKSRAASRTTSRTLANNSYDEEPTDSGRVQAIHGSEAATRRFASMMSCRAGCTSALMCERSPINTSGHGRKSRRRQ